VILNGGLTANFVAYGDQNSVPQVRFGRDIEFFHGQTCKNTVQNFKIPSFEPARIGFHYENQTIADVDGDKTLLVLNNVGSLARVLRFKIASA
jgi:hypothetical protein